MSDLYFGEQKLAKNKCCVPKCEDRYSSRFRFPNPKDYSDMCAKWIEKIKNPLLTGKSYSYIYKTFRVCASHFTEESFIQGSRKGIKFSAIPVLHMPGNETESK